MEDIKVCDYEDIYGLTIKKDVPYVDSRWVAEFFEKEHKHVLELIRKLQDTKNSGITEEFIGSNFRPIYYTDRLNRKKPSYLLTRDGFTMLVMNFSGKKANQFKEMYIKRFNEMESFIKTLQIARADFPKLTDNIKLAYGTDLKPWTYSNECNMINKIVLGVNTQQFKKENNITDKSIRPYLSEEQLKQVDELQLMDSGLVLGVSDYHQRKIILENYYLTHLK